MFTKSGIYARNPHLLRPEGLFEKEAGLIRSIIKLMRPTQWIKNGFVFMPLVFSAQMYYPSALLSTITMFAIFCLASSATYIFNDYMDMDQDQAHPVKKNRPLASGALNPGIAFTLMLGLLGISFAAMVILEFNWQSFAVVGAYLILQVFYCVILKNVVILDVFTLSSGFLLRVLAGAAAIDVEVSSWLVLCTFSVAILLALGKRRHEVLILGADAGQHRPVLEHYSVSLLDQLLQLVATSTFIFYCLYCVRDNPELGQNSDMMIVTIPLVTYGIFRYMWLIYHKKDGGSPTSLLLTDPPLLACATIWLVACSLIIYW
jgi:4-hydroxybenzoate polyprenyltransferase